MAWWFWILLWVALIALSLLYVGLLGLRLFRGFMRTMAELEQAGTKLSRLEGRTADVEDADEHVFMPGVFRDRESVRVEYLSGKLERTELRRQRRLERKRERNQPRSLRDLPSL